MATGKITTQGNLTIFAGKFTVNGGTGQFVNATGKGEVFMILFPDGSIVQAYEGTITL